MQLYIFSFAQHYHAFHGHDDTIDLIVTVH
jgi:hypothetical protein